MINLKILRNIIKNNPLKKEKAISEQILNNKNNIIYPDSDLINVIDTPHIVLNDKNNISFINNATKKIFNINIKNNIFHVFRRPEFRENIKKFRKSRAVKHQFTLELFSVPQTSFFNIKIYKLQNNNILLSFIDITRLHKLENLRSDFIGNVSHELKTPLSTLMNIIELFIHQKKITAKEKNKLLKILEQESLKMKSIIDDLLHLTKIETQLTKKISQKVDLNKIIHECVESLKTNAKKNGIHIKIKTIKTAKILGDNNQLQQIFKNIIDNSIKYAYKNSLLLIELKSFKNKLVVIFTDHGKGIPNSLIPRLTERFYRVPDVKIKKIEGSGLGLAIVKYIAIRHGAEFNMSSILNKGTTTKIFFKKK